MTKSIAIPKEHAELLALACESYARQLRERPTLEDTDDGPAEQLDCDDLPPEYYDVPEYLDAPECDYVADYLDAPNCCDVHDFIEAPESVSAEDYIAAQLESLANKLRGINSAPAERSHLKAGQPDSGDSESSASRLAKG
jgi:hypothetical protein